jgi:8-oxo-dGTP pyrophosphatase MutT (NUDIX family)
MAEQTGMIPELFSSKNRVQLPSGHLDVLASRQERSGANNQLGPYNNIQHVAQVLDSLRSKHGDNDTQAILSAALKMATQDQKSQVVKARHLQLMSEILVMLYGDKAPLVAQKLIGGAAFSINAALSSQPKVIRRYGKQPGPGWVRAGTSSRGTQIWRWGPNTGSSGSGGGPIPTSPPPASPPPPPSSGGPIPTSPPPAPPPTPAAPAAPARTPFTPVATPHPSTLKAGGQRARAQSIIAYNHAMSILTSGQQLSAIGKAELAKKLTNMPTPLLQNLHAALGGTARVTNQKAAVTAVRGILGAAARPNLYGVPPTPAPTPAVPPPPPASPPAPASPPPPASTPWATSRFASNLQQQAVNRLQLGLQLSPAMKTDLISNLQYMGGTQLSDLHKALGGSGSGFRAQVITDITSMLQAPPPVPPPPPAASATPPVPKFMRPPVGAADPTGPIPKSTVAQTTYETGKPQPGSLNGVDFNTAPAKFWEKVKDVDVGEPKTGTRHTRAGILIQEPDGRIWICRPTNGFGDRKYTLPGGTIEPGLSDQQNALKETWEETGIQCEITGYLGDFDDANYGGAGQSSRTGRLYIGKRVGGSPWDAKIESHIIDKKTGKPSAESSHVDLVTPEQAMKLLHRTDDLAQLMAVAPIPVNTPTSGKGSEPIKKFLAAIKPKVDQYVEKQKKKGITYGYGNGELHAVQEMRGYNKKPKVVAKKDFDALVKQGTHIELLRGVKPVGGFTGQNLADEFKTGDHFPGHGIFGSGTYTDPTKGAGNVASSYAGYSGSVIRMAIPKTAKIIKTSELEKAVPKHPDLFKGYYGSGGKSPDLCWLGVQAALAGYDAIENDAQWGNRNGAHDNKYIVVLNRSIVTVQQEDAKGHKIK